MGVEDLGVRLAAGRVEAPVELEDGVRFESVVPDARDDAGIGVEVCGEEAELLGERALALSGTGSEEVP